MANYRGGRGGLPAATPVVKNLIIINVLVWLAELYFDKPSLVLDNGVPVMEWYGGLWSIHSGNFKIWQLVTHMFMHEAWEVTGPMTSSPVFSHIFFNMFVLYIFGSILENFWGAKRFLQFYMICGVLAGVTQLIFGGDGYAIGASGAVMGVMAGFAYLFPNTDLYLMFIPIPIKAKYVVGGLIAFDVYGTVSTESGDSVAHWAHLGGALVGILVVIIWNKTRKRDFY
jgi:membrane associated rhomboid family serine protease